MNSGTLVQQLLNVRSFPLGEKNCYNLTTPQGKNNKYLIRATFMYGNYDSENEVPEFGVSLGFDEWGITFQNALDVVTVEIVHMPETDYIYLCLLKSGSTTPFISTLELRQLNNATYGTTSRILKLAFRLDVGSTTNKIIR